MAIRGSAPKPGDRVLWIRFGAFGDVLQAAAGAQRFKLRYPETELTFMTRPEYADIVRTQPYVDGVIQWDPKRPWGGFSTARAASRFDWVFSLHQGGAAACLALASGVTRRFGYNRSMQFCYAGTHWDALDSLGVDFMNRDGTAIFTTREADETAKALLGELAPRKRRLFAVIGASKPQKLWPVRHWVEFLRHLLAKGDQSASSWSVVLNGWGEAEARTAREITEALPSGGLLSLVGKMDYAVMAAAAKLCDAAAGNDSGPLHLAALAGTPTLGFFGPTDSYRLGFRAPWFREVQVSCPDAGCWNYRCPQKNECLADITPQRALAGLEKLMDIT
ncbi:MAG: glycosyltransferase family 9 protein [Synergistaceae bacterium]|jgi:ADP-heptose:LPS heptosyltransferase|nr:glycosyltransferase family 9 protein [Synergistaceae bacterium]